MLGLCAFTARGWGSIPGQGTKIPQATLRSQKKKKKLKDSNPGGCDNKVTVFNYSARDSPSVVPRPAAPALPGNLLEMQILSLHSPPVQSETLGVGPVVCVLTHPLLVIPVSTDI